MDNNQLNKNFIDEEKRGKELSKLFQNARDVMEKLEASVKRDKKQIVVKLARNLKSWIQIDTICIEIVTHLRGQVSERFIRHCLDERYKQKVRIENARKQKRQNSLNHNKDGKLAELVPLNHENGNSKVTLIETSGQALIQEDGNTKNKSSSPVSGDSSYCDTKWTSVDSSGQQVQKEQPQHKNRPIIINECPSCIELDSENSQLREALEKSNPFVTAIDLKKFNEDKQSTIGY